MKKVFISIVALLLISCGNSVTKTNDGDSVIASAIDEDESSQTDEDNDSMPIQTGGVTFFTYNENSDESQMFTSSEMLGKGGFFGYTIYPINDTYYAIGALHESTPPFDFSKASGALYIFKKGTIPTTPDDAVMVLHHPENALNVGFSFAVAGPCDINNDGNEDLVVSAHLATVAGLAAAGQIITFYGDADGWKTENSSISYLSESYIDKSDVMGQSLICADIDGDSYADILAGGQNAGPAIVGGGSSGMVAFFAGGNTGLAEHESWVLLPKLQEKALYFGATMLYADFDLDGTSDLVVGAWGAPKNGEKDAVKSGAVYFYKGGDDWQIGATTITSDSEGEAGDSYGSVIKFVPTPTMPFFSVLTTGNGAYGKVSFYTLSSNAFPTTPLFATSLSSDDNLGDDATITSYDTIAIPPYQPLFVAGGKHFSQEDGGDGLLYCWDISDTNISNGRVCPWQPEISTGGFGATVQTIENIDASGQPTLLVSAPELIVDSL
ncbi:FG-GAP repeat protein [bacterium]|nr:FG-GAP repeat protein [bacterium]